MENLQLPAFLKQTQKRQAGQKTDTPHGKGEGPKRLEDRAEPASSVPFYSCSQAFSSVTKMEWSHCLHFGLHRLS